MRRLTLILSDLYLPEEAAATRRPADDATAGTRVAVAVRADPVRVGDWRTWLLSAGWPDELVAIPLARRSAAHAELLERSALDTAWLATPVHLEARLDHVRLRRSRSAAPRAAEARGAGARSSRATSVRSISCTSAASAASLLSGIARRSATPTVDPARLLGCGHRAGAAGGREAPELRRLGAEIEMWLHGAALNGERERAGRPPRLGVVAVGRRCGVRAARAAALRHGTWQFYGGDPLITCD